MSSGTHRVKESLWKFIYWPILWTITLGVPYIVFGEFFTLSYTSKLIFRMIGTILLIWAFLLHGVAGRTLRYFGHKDPKNRSIWPDKLVTRGIYSCMRHPQHLGLLLVPIAISLIVASPIVIISSGWAVVGTLLFILFIEEPECLVKFGEDYLKYMRLVKPFNLDPRCLIVGLRYLKDYKK